MDDEQAEENSHSSTPVGTLTLQVNPYRECSMRSFIFTPFFLYCAFMLATTYTALFSSIIHLISDITIKNSVFHRLPVVGSIWSSVLVSAIAHLHCRTRILSIYNETSL
jgi:hypothetical protein